MKKTYLYYMAPSHRIVLTLLVILSSTVFCSITMAQVVTSELEIKTEIITNYVEGESEGIISIEVSGNPPFTYLLYNKPPWEEGILIREKKEIQVYNFRIEGLNQQNYFIMVKDADDIIGAKKIAFQ